MFSAMGRSFDASGSFASFSVPTLLSSTNYSLSIDEALLEEMTRFQGAFIFHVFSLGIRLLLLLISLSLGVL